MNEKCCDIGTIQAFLDGELGVDSLETVSQHIASCEQCAILLVEAEEESAVAFSALEQELNTFVPTQRLWKKINHSIQKEEKSVWQTVTAFFSNQATIAFACVLIVFSIFVALTNLENGEKASEVATETIQKTERLASVPIVDPAIPEIAGTRSAPPPQNHQKPQVKQIKEIVSNQNVDRVVRNSSVKNGGKNSNLQRRFYSPNSKPKDFGSTAEVNISGEDSYIRTIATLEKTVDIQKDEVLNSSARFAFERDLAVSDDAIKKMKIEVRRNPKDEAAKQILRASYQNKIDLLNSVADKTDLMASLR